MVSYKTLVAGCAVLLTAVPWAGPGPGVASAAPAATGGAYRHVLLISVDGLHALDVANYVTSHPRSTLAELAGHGVTYSSANTPFTSDSFPGLLALATGGSSLSHQVYYDVSYDRTAFSPSNPTCSGQPGAIVKFDESVDLYRAEAGTGEQISNDVLDVAALPHRRDAAGHCVPFYPHSLLEVNTIFEVVHSLRGRTAWSDKHPVYEVLNGPSGTGVDDLFTPEMTHIKGYDSRNSVVCTAENDMRKVEAVLNQIRGRTHDGRSQVGVPVLFGTNLQAVSVAQKLAREAAAKTCSVTDEAALSGQSGGYVDGQGTPSAVLQYGLDRTDQALGKMVAALRAAGLYESTLIVVTAKHGQSPINPVSLNKVGRFAKTVAALPDADASEAARAIAAAGACESGPCGHIEDDDIAMIWLAQQGQAPEVARYLERNARALNIAQVLSGASLQLRLNNPLQDKRTPDIIVVPNYGVIYSESTAKNAEHGGLNYSDTNVGLIVSSPHIQSRTIKVPVLSSQVAPSILAALGINPSELDAVRLEFTAPLPGLEFPRNLR